MKKVESTQSCVSTASTTSSADSAISTESISTHPEAVLDALAGKQDAHVCRRVTSFVISTAAFAGIAYALVRFIPLTTTFGGVDQMEEDLPHKDAAEWVIFLAGLNVCFFNGLVAIPVVLLFLRTRLKQALNNTTRSSLTEVLVGESVSVVIPCYMPNEQYLIRDTIEHVRSNLLHNGRVTVYVAYNTPKELSIERDLQLLASQHHSSGRELVVFKVEGSKSKAENLNAVLQTIQDDYTVIYDADHHPDPDSLQTLMSDLHAHKADCIQGSTYLRNHTSSIMARIIDAEFYVCYFVMFTALQFVARTGFFGGSNALWRTEALRSQEFDESMQTEDIDFATRAIIGGKKIRFCPTARSGELAPSSLAAVFKQRIRWAMGWDQVSIKHVLRGSVMGSEIPLARKIGVMYALGPMRWALAMMSIFGAVCMPILAWAYPPSSWPLSIVCVFKLSFIEFLLVFTASMLEALFHEEFLQCIFIAGFLACGPLYVLFQTGMLILSLFRIARGKTGGWVVTQRSAPLLG